MNNLWKKLAVSSGIALLAFCQDGRLQVKAEEIATIESTTEEVATTEDTTEEIKAVDTLQWKKEDWLVDATITFQIPNEKGSASYKVEVNWDSQWTTLNADDDYSNREKGTVIELDLRQFININRRDCDYTVRVTTFNMDGESVGETEAIGRYLIVDYWPMQYLSEYGHIAIKLRDWKDVVSYHMTLSNGNGVNVDFTADDDYSDREQGTIVELDISEYLLQYPESEWYFHMDTHGIYDDGYATMGGYISRSHWSTPESENTPTESDNDSTSGNTSEEGADTEDNGSDSMQETSKPVKDIVNEILNIIPWHPWMPTTPDEWKRYAAFGKEKVVFTVDMNISYNIVIENTMQGPLCFDSFESVLGDWTIARTYNILPFGGYSYNMDQKAHICLQIPIEVQAEGRVYQMICVTKDGVPVILTDLDSDQNTITFETDKYYAFALVYKDK